MPPSDMRGNSHWFGLARIYGPFVAVALLFAVCPDIDLAVSRLFFGASRHFVMGGPIADTVRRLGFDLPFAVLGLMLSAGLLKLIVRRIPGPDWRAVAFLVLTMALGPGLLVNVVLKDHAHRPRPVHVEDFGGKAEFKPFYRFDGACSTNCSFVSGETSGATWLLAPAMLAPPPLRAPAMAAALAFASLVGLLRIGYGGHFLSDVIFAMILTFLVIRWTGNLLLRREAMAATAETPGPLAQVQRDAIVPAFRRPGE